ncbi:MAG: hypothetical protein K8S54_13635 [Spirochaetia bacterium]|nr:hypothetical protein [Spirochaetia bacterium]
MKPIHEVEETRKKYHLYPNKNTVHRSSLMAPAIAGCDVYISFLNHFLLKRGYQSVALKITAVGRQGNLLDSITFDVKDPIVYTFNLSRLFAEKNPENFLVEFFSDKNLFIPFPAVMVNHVGKDFVNVVHSYNRVLNDIFENDSVNKTQVAEASIDVVCDSTYDTFVTFATGIVSVRDSLRLSYAEKNKSVQGALAIDLPRLSSKSYFLSEVIPDLKNSKGGVIKLSQPVQSMFYGRLLAGIVNRQTGAFSANHSYYDSSAVAEYFPDPDSYRTYPLFA